MEDAVEPSKEAAEQTVHGLGQAVFRRVMAFQQQGRQRRRQGQGIESRNDGGKGDGEGKLPIKFAGQPADEGDRHEHGAQHQGDGDDRAGDFAHRLQGGIARAQPILDIALDILHHHDGVIDHDADRQH